MHRAGRLIIMAMTAFLFLSIFAWPASAASPSGKDITIGVMIPRTGEWSTLADIEMAVLDAAQTDVNQFLAQINSPSRVTFMVEDTESNPVVALDKLKQLDARGVKAVIGPDSSAELAAVADYANQNGLLLFSTGSTSPALAIKDNIYQFALTDNFEALRMAQLMQDDGIEVVVPIVRDDLFGRGYVQALTAPFQDMSGIVAAPVMYSSNTTDFSPALEALTGELAKAISTHGADKVAVFLVAADEMAVIFSKAANATSKLGDVRWYGAGSASLNDALMQDLAAAQFAASVQFRSLTFAADEQDEKTRALAQRVKQATGRDLDGYSAAAYDAVWLLALSHLMVNDREDSEQIRAAFLRLSDTYQGLTGEMNFDANGQRKYGRFQQWIILLEDGKPQWVAADQFLLTPTGWY